MLIRAAPMGLFISDPDAVQAIYSTKSPVSKGPWYNLMEPRILLQGTRDKAEHARRRKIWDPAFTAKGVFNRPLYGRLQLTHRSH